VFFEQYLLLCSAKGVSPSKAAQDNNISKTSVTRWRTGAIPNAEILQKLALYFDVSTDYLLGNTDIKNKPAANNSNELTDNTKIFIEKFMQLTPEQREFVEAQIDVLLSRKSNQ